MTRGMRHAMSVKVLLPALLLLVLVLTTHACVTPPDTGAGTRDAGRALSVLSIEARDMRGATWPLDAMPRQPLILIWTSAPLEESDPQPALLLEGEADDALLGDLEGAPLRSENAARIAPCDVSRIEGAIVLVPRAALAPGGRYVAAVGGWATAGGERIAAPFMSALRVSSDPAAGARATDAWPADGTAGVAPLLALAAIRFDGDVERAETGVTLEDEDAARVPAEIAPIDCRAIGWASGECIRVVPAARLDPLEQYRLVVKGSVVDATGAPVGPWQSSFTTAADDDATPPAWLETVCAIDETAIDVGCALADDRSVTLRVRASEPVRLALDSTVLRTTEVAPRGEAVLRIDGLGPGALVGGTLRAIDAAGLSTDTRVEVSTTEMLAAISITEVRADPSGPEPAQEYVEVLNFGATVMDLAGFTLSDTAASEGDVLPAGAIVSPHARALLVADAFDPEDGADDAVPAGTVLVRIGASLGSSGLSNRGEALFLRDPLGRRVSAAPASPPPRSGACVVRATADPRDGRAGTFAYDANGRCTPGEVDRASVP